METCLLIPSQLSIAVTRHSDPRNVFEKTASIWSKAFISAGFTFYPDGGQIYHGCIDIHSTMERTDIRRTFGGYDLILDLRGHKMRHCNWIRFLRSTTELKAANIMGTWVGNIATYRTVKNIEIGEELLVFFTNENESAKETEHCTDDEDTEIDVCGLSDTGEEDGRDSPQSYRTEPNIFVKSPAQLICASPRPSHLSKKMRFSRDDECDSGIDLTNTPDFLKSVSTPEPYEEFKRAHLDDGLHSTPLSSSGNTLKRKRGKTWLTCGFCDKTFDRPSLLKRHERTHTGERPHVCDVCSKAFSTSSSLNTHRRIHFGEKPHQCTVCGKRFTASSNLYYHKMTHIKEKPHKCTLCTKSFPTPGDLRSHIHIHNGTYPFQCEVCQKGFSKQSSLKHHMSSHTATTIYNGKEDCPEAARYNMAGEHFIPSTRSLTGSSTGWSQRNRRTASPRTHTAIQEHSFLPTWFHGRSVSSNASSSTSVCF